MNHFAGIPAACCMPAQSNTNKCGAMSFLNRAAQRPATKEQTFISTAEDLFSFQLHVQINRLTKSNNSLVWNNSLMALGHLLCYILFG